MLPLLSICNNISINSHHLKDPNTGNLQMTVLYIHDLILPELFHLLHCTGLDVDKNQFEYVHFVIHLLIYTLDVTVLWIQYTWTKTTFCVQFKSRIYHVDKFNHFLYVNMYTTFKMFPIDNRTQWYALISRGPHCWSINNHPRIIPPWKTQTIPFGLRSDSFKEGNLWPRSTCPPKNPDNSFGESKLGKQPWGGGMNDY